MKRLATPLLTIFFAVPISHSLLAQHDIYNTNAPEIVHLWSRIADFAPLLRSVEAAEISPDGRLVLSGSKFGYNVMMWRVADGALVWEAAHDSEIECVTFSPDSKLAATGGEDFMVNIWEAATGKLLHSLEHDQGLDGLTWSHDGQTLAAGTEKGDIVFWDVPTWQQIRRVNVGSTINSLQFLNDDSHILVGGNVQTPQPGGGTHYGGFAKLVHVGTGKLAKEYTGFEASVKSVRLTSDERLLATASFDNVVRVFDKESGQLLKAFEQPLRMEAVAFTPDDLYLTAGGHEKSLKFYRMADYELVFELSMPRIEYIHFSADGRLMLTAHEDSGLISLYMLLSDTQHRQDVYHRIADQILNNKDLK